MSDAAWHLLDHHGKLDRIYALLEDIMAGQASIDAAVAQLASTQATEATAVATLAADVTAIQAELAAGVDTTALDAAVAAQAGSDADLVSAVNDVTALASPPPATS
jgi:hypothetical protein